MIVRFILSIAPLVAASANLPQLSIYKRSDLAVEANSKRQDDSVSTNLFEAITWLGGGGYFANVTVGTPPQPQSILIDTGSSDTFFISSTASECYTSSYFECIGGTFNRSGSSTYRQVAAAPAFQVAYVDGSEAYGPFGADVFGIGEFEISNVQFGVATSSYSASGHNVGLMGTGFAIGEAAVLSGDSNETYPNMPEVLVNAGVIKSRLYSIFLNDQSAYSGTILFGGIDTSKYTGDLVTINMIPEPGYDVITRFITTVTGMTATVGGVTSTVFTNGTAGSGVYRDQNALPVLLDTGAANWNVPVDFYLDFILPTFPYIDSDYLCSCKYRDSGDKISLEFNGQATIEITAQEFIIPFISVYSKRPLAYGDGYDTCRFGIYPQEESGQGFNAMGDAILRSMYVVYDLDNGQVSIAQAAVNTTAEPNVVEVEAGPSGVARAAANVATTVANTWPVYPLVTESAELFSVKTLASPLGTASGAAAVPIDALPLPGTTSTNSRSRTYTRSPITSSTGAAPQVTMPAMGCNSVWTLCAGMLFAAYGVAA